MCYTRSWIIEGLFSFLAFTHVHAQIHKMHDGFCQADIVMFRGYTRQDHKNCFHGAKIFFTLLKCNLDFTL